MKKLLIASTSKVYGSDFLEYLHDELLIFFKFCKNILFIPYARPSGLTHDQYTEMVSKNFKRINKKIIGLHKFKNKKKALSDCEAIFVGGGNTFVLLNQLVELELIDTLKNVINSGTPYLGTSAGANICGPSISTTNDMPIVNPINLQSLNILPFNINSHYLDPIQSSKHMGETRETRIKEFHFFNDETVIGLREGSYLMVMREKVILKGELSARIFKKFNNPYEIPPETDLSYIT